MYRITKVLNHNTVMAIQEEDKKSYLIMEKGIGFGKKISERIEAGDSAAVYSLQESTERGNAGEMVKSISPECLEIANEILDKAEKEFGKVDRNILFPMADHIEYAIKRIENDEQIRNPLNDDIRVMFQQEYKVAQQIEPILRERMGIQIGEDEIGYVTLHIHSAIEDEKVSQAMLVAQAVRECISIVEKEVGHSIDVMSLSYNRLMNHVRFMVARALGGEKLKMSMNDYMKIKFPKTYKMAESICDKIAASLKCKLDEVEIGYLAIHIERVTNEEGHHTS